MECASSPPTLCTNGPITRNNFRVLVAGSVVSQHVAWVLLAHQEHGHDVVAATAATGKADCGMSATAPNAPAHRHQWRRRSMSRGHRPALPYRSRHLAGRQTQTD